MELSEEEVFEIRRCDFSYFTTQLEYKTTPFEIFEKNIESLEYLKTREKTLKFSLSLRSEDNGDVKLYVLKMLSEAFLPCVSLPSLVFFIQPPIYIIWCTVLAVAFINGFYLPKFFPKYIEDLEQLDSLIFYRDSLQERVDYIIENRKKYTEEQRKILINIEEENELLKSTQTFLNEIKDLENKITKAGF